MCRDKKQTGRQELTSWRPDEHQFFSAYFETFPLFGLSFWRPAFSASWVKRDHRKHGKVQLQTTQLGRRVNGVSVWPNASQMRDQSRSKSRSRSRSRTSHDKQTRAYFWQHAELELAENKSNKCSNQTKILIQVASFCMKAYTVVLPVNYAYDSVQLTAASEAAAQSSRKEMA